MTYLEYEESVEAGRPLEIYHFYVGTEHFYYTSAEDTISYGGNSYVSRQIERNSPEQSVEEGKSRLEITLPTDDPVCSRFIGVVPPSPMHVVLTRFHRQDLLSGVVLWTGRVVQAAYLKQGSRCKMTVVPSEAVFSRTLPPFKYQGLCNHKLYDGGCTVDPDSFEFAGTASSVSGSYLTVNGLTASKGAGWALGGKATVGSDVRLIVGQSGDVLRLSLPFASDPGGQAITVNAGCDHLQGTCESKFSNLINYGGFPFVPTKNPFATGIK